MRLRKRFGLLILVISVLPMELACCCFGDESCGFDSDCPYTRPPCYKVTIWDFRHGYPPCEEGSSCLWCETEDGSDCDPNLCDIPVYASMNGTWILRYDGYESELCHYINTSDDVWIDINESYTLVYGSHGGCSGDCSYKHESSREPNAEDVANDHSSCSVGGCGYFCGGGYASWEPIWDCSACGYACDLSVTVKGDRDHIHYAREDCCPPAEAGEEWLLEFSCGDAEYVVPSYTIEVRDPNDPNSSATWIEVEDSNLVTVTPDPNECSSVSSVSFTIQALKGRPPARARVTCSAWFFDISGAMGGASRTVYIEPAHGECCEDSTSCTSPGCSTDGGVSPPGLGMKPTFGSICAGSACFSIYAGMDEGDEVSSATLYDLGGGKTGIVVKLPGVEHSYRMDKLLSFMPGWFASITDANTVTVTSPDDAKYIYKSNIGYKLYGIREFNGTQDVNVVTFEYDGGKLDKQRDANDPSNRYIEYTYSDDQFDTITVNGSASDSRGYSVTYDGSGRVIAFTNNDCQSCGAGAYRYEFDTNDLLVKVRDANDPNVVLYEYVYNASGWVTDIYIGEANDANHLREFEYTPNGDDGDYIVDIYDHLDANSYRVSREYRDSAGNVAKRIRYEVLNDDPEDPADETRCFVENIFYTFDVNNVMTEKVVLPAVPLSDTNEPDPDSGARKVYVYDPNYNGRLLTETWYDANDVNFTVVSNTYQLTPDGNNVRMVSSVDARDANTVYYYEGNSVDPNLKVMPEVNDVIYGIQQLKYGYEYDYRKRITLEKKLNKDDAILVRTKYEYDSRGNLVKRYDAYDSSGQEITEHRYNGYNEPNRTTVRLGDGSVVSGRWYNDGGGLLSEGVLANPDDIGMSEPNLMSQTRYYYDGNGRLEKVARAVHTGEFKYDQPNSWVETEYVYDWRGNRIQVIEDANDATGLKLTTAYEHNRQGEVTKVTLPTGKWTQTIRDGRGLVVETKVGHGGTTAATTTYSYDVHGNLEEQTAPNGVRTRYEYDDFDRVIKVTRGY